jgi:DNA-binding NtrC family response regulator
MAEGQPPPRRRVLLVDDERDFLEILSLSLARRGFEVIAVEGGVAALAAAGAQKLDLVITDFKMPDVDGVELVKALKALDPGLPVIVASGYVSAKQWEVLARNGAAAFLQKPFGLEALYEAMARSL